MRLKSTPPPSDPSDPSAAPAPAAEPSVQSVARRGMLGFLLFWLLVMGVLYWAMQMYLKPAGVKVQADGTVAIARDRDGHFRVEGAVNGQPVMFLVDTGASMVGVTEPLAERAGLGGGEPVRFRTANGERDGRMVVAEQVRVASLVVSGLRVGTGYTGSTDRDALLGQNFLRQFDVEIRGDRMLIHPRGSGSSSKQ
ncbi:TIGR02281 family clan AA aspartic protease [Delftia acidovorans]|uniref:retropepsin-like aspartic protease family protein n=1 Tax=Delftia acidovorans TaxID=80866 RepID=UPI001E57ABDF|nr:TIGR02281 family clan AA aspartic protease [Delftia acidovorans]